jgi:hypothetical protein
LAFPAYLKRADIIYDYSQWGYWESQNVYYYDDYYKTLEHIFTYKGSEIKEGDLGSLSNPFKGRQDVIEVGYSYDLDAEYKGVKLGSMYIDGCFNAYLYKAG